MEIWVDKFWLATQHPYYSCQRLVPQWPFKQLKEILSWTKKNVVILKGELTCPEIWIVRVAMEGLLQSCADLSNLYAPASEVPNDQVPPTLIYSGTRRKTGKVLEVLAAARGTPDDASNARSKLARRYHSCTGKNDKTLCVEDFGNERFPVVSCTLALGMGQNWKRVQSLITMGRADPSATCQMIGWCGRDGKPGFGDYLCGEEPVRWQK
jgi:superfamily II DNA helicase RecQ